MINIIFENTDDARRDRNIAEAFCVGDRTIWINAVAFLLEDLLRLLDCFLYIIVNFRVSFSLW